MAAEQADKLLKAMMIYASDSRVIVSLFLVLVVPASYRRKWTRRAENSDLEQAT